MSSVRTTEPSPGSSDTRSLIFPVTMKPDHRGSGSQGPPLPDVEKPDDEADSETTGSSKLSTYSTW